ncbi:MAG: DUF3320 domain-containing protein [Candidatus Omnitrophota bacterium]|jgi:superfamily I DNA and/or RNA helicase/very-short-patch-repair endonuclease
MSKEKILKQIEEWRKRLIDLSRRNQLIFFNEKRKNLLEISKPELIELWEKISAGKEIDVWLPPEDEDESPRKAAKEPRPNDVVFTLDTKKDIEKRLKSIYRRALSDYSEKGTRTSMLAVGLLNWKEQSTGELVKSPILLCPVSINQATPKDPYSIEQADEEPVLNPAIKVKLLWDFKIDLPEPALEEESFDLDKYFKQIAALGKRDGWFVEDRAFLSNFSFHKISMYQDLSLNASLISDNTIIKGLAEGHYDDRERSEEIGAVPEETELDNSTIAQRMLYILDADSSQAKAIEAAMKGHSFVLKGPPGTGKSQTITNIISEFLEAGKTVLFVSEKMAALEVVYSRLQEAKLTDFCLELHSHKANKKEVVKELMRCVETHPVAEREVSKVEFQRLKTLRDKLNSYVLELHKIREPIGESIYQTFGRLIKLDKYPLVPIGAHEDNFYEPAFMQSLNELLIRLKTCYRVAEEGDKFPWRGFKQISYSQEIRMQYHEKINKVRERAVNLRDGFLDYASSIDLEPPQSMAGCKWLIQLSKLLNNNPQPLKIWLEVDIGELVGVANKYKELSLDYQKQRDIILKDYRDSIFSLPEETRDKLTNASNKFSSFVARAEINQDVLVSLDKIEQSLRINIEKLKRWDIDLRELTHSTGISFSEDISIIRAMQLVDIVNLLFITNKPDKNWFDPVVLKHAHESFKLLKEHCLQFNKINSELMGKYTNAFYQLDLGRLINDFEITYRGIKKYFMRRYYTDKSLIKRVCNNGIIPQDICNDFKKAQEAINIKSSLQAKTSDYANVLGAYYQGVETDIVALDEALNSATNLIELVGSLPLPNILTNSASLSGVANPNLKIIGNRVKASVEEFRSSIEDLSDLLNLNTIGNSGLSVNESSLRETKIYLEHILASSEEFHDILRKILSHKLDTNLNSCGQLLDALSIVNATKSIETTFGKNTEPLQQKFGVKFQGLKTEWDKIINELNWIKDFREFTRDNILPDEFISKVVKGINTTLDETRELEEMCNKANDEIMHLQSDFDGTANFFQQIQLNQLTFEELIDFLGYLSERINDLAMWLEYAIIIEDFKRKGLADFIEKLIKLHPAIEDLPLIFQKSYYQSWANKICSEVPVLGEFRGANHEEALSEFRNLDKKLSTLSAAMIIKELNKQKPNYVSIEGAEISIVRNEAAKKVRHMPVRVLFGRIPRLLLKLKPCLLMSPLSVSLFLDAQKYKFDLIIFDEASQICSEDAIGAISRGKQLVVAGDNRQLPPTKFFQGEYLEEDEDVEEATGDIFGIYQSVLDDCERIGLTPQPLMLRWHYRSKHEGLIAYSNHRFYDSKLVTFPCAKENDPMLGIKFVHIPDGVFDRGGKRNNIKEAERIADLVFEHFTKYGEKKTLGVATLNIPQRDLVLDVIEQRRRIQPEFEKYFLNDRLSGFFVKNLESVQGDERDVIILSLGYGRDSAGKLSMNFGPINKEGGERRLNVIVTRSKEKLILVSSLRASDFDLANLNTEGVRHLYHYLDYAERGREALSILDVNLGDAESLFEEEVINEVRALGFDAISQVGCSGFRVDIGVVDPAHPGCFILGIECDGATYHSAYTARERDRIRQAVLENLGWRIHRVWSTDWFNRRKEEVAKLKYVLEQARTGEYCAPNYQYKNFQVEIGYKVKKPQDISENGDKKIIEYKIYKRRKLLPSYEFNKDDNIRIEVLTDIVECEGPIHKELAVKRMMYCWGISRLGPVIQESFDRTVQTCVRTHCFYRKGDFLWFNNNFKATHVRKPYEHDEDTIRVPEHVALEEIELAISLVIKNALSISKEPLFSEVSKLFKWGRVTERVENAVSKALKQLVNSGTLVISQDNLISFSKD